MDPTVWGPAFWKTIHHVALGYPAHPTPEDVRDYRAFFSSLDRVLPCHVCAVNYRRHFDDDLPIDPYLTGGRRLFDWTVLLHNVVNTENGKLPWKVEDAYAFYASGRGGAGAGGGVAVTMALATLIAFLAIATVFIIVKVRSKK
jgi:FAD-linked sulfhydryl oxidase